MKIICILLQNSKGEPLLLACSNQFPLTASLNYSYLIYSHIITCYKNNLKLERSFALTNDRYCISNVTKDFILSVIVSKNDLMLGFDGLRKLSDYFNRNVRIDTLAKRIVEMFGVFEEFLFCRELPLGENWLSIRPDRASRKRAVDLQVLNRFGHIHYEQEKRTVVEIQLRQSKLEEISNGFKKQVLRNSRNFCIKVFEEENLAIDPAKERFIVSYKNRLFANGFGKRKPEPLQVTNVEEESLIGARRKDSGREGWRMSKGGKEKQGENEMWDSKTLGNQSSVVENNSSFKDFLATNTKLRQSQIVSRTARLPSDDPADIFLPEELEETVAESLGEVPPQPTNSKEQSSIASFPFPLIKSSPPFATITQALTLSPPSIPKIEFTPTSQGEISFMDVFHVPCSPRPNFASISNNSSAKVRMNEKLQLVLIDEKVKNVNQYGQVAVEISTHQKINISLVSSNWFNKKYVITRITPNSFKVKQLDQQSYEVEVDELSKSKGVIDYILSKQTFNYNKIPLMFISNFETRKNSKQNIIQYTFKYKVNDKWKGTLHDIDIQIVLDPYIIFSDCKTNPLANSLKGKVVNWKAKELTENAKGKLALALYDSTMDPKDIIKEIKLSMRAEKSLLAELDVECSTGGGSVKSRAKKNLIIEYKILPK